MVRMFLVEEVLYQYSLRSAYTSFEETKAESLSEGKFGDFIRHDRNICIRIRMKSKLSHG